MNSRAPMTGCESIEGQVFLGELGGSASGGGLGEDPRKTCGDSDNARMACGDGDCARMACGMNGR